MFHIIDNSTNEPIVIGYNETIIKWSTEVNGDYDLEEIPEITEV